MFKQFMWFIITSKNLLAFESYSYLDLSFFNAWIIQSLSFCLSQFLGSALACGYAMFLRQYDILQFYNFLSQVLNSVLACGYVGFLRQYDIPQFYIFLCQFLSSALDCGYAGFLRQYDIPQLFNLLYQFLSSALACGCAWYVTCLRLLLLLCVCCLRAESRGQAQRLHHERVMKRCIRKTMLPFLLPCHKLAR